MTRVLSLALIAATCCAAVRAAEPLKELAEASKAFLKSLDPDQRALAQMPFNADERLNWHYVPMERAGLPLKRMSPEQRELAVAVLKAVLSAQGFQKTESIRGLEDVLKAMGGTIVRDPDLYYFTFFGEPSLESNWGLRYEGHHVSLQWTVIGGRVVATTPQFLGANPAEVREGPLKGTRVLAAEEDLGRQLVQSLQGKQRDAAVISPDAPPEILTGAAREASIQEDLGVPYRDLDAEQQGLLISLVQVYANAQRPELAADRLDRLRTAGLDAIKFAWMGGLEKGQKHYYRIQGPTFLIEYDDTQNDANHIHTVWRDFKGDFGEDVLKQHYLDHASADHPDEHVH